MPDAARVELFGDCFVVLRTDGFFWSAQGWVAEWTQARQFGGPGDPYADCLALVTRLRDGGDCCLPYYIPRQLTAPEIVIA